MSRPTLCALVLLLGSAWATLLPAQTPAASPVAAAAATITPAALAHYARVLAADSFHSRATPSAALERTARYVADQFTRLGLTPAGDQVRKVDSAGEHYRTPEGHWAVDTIWFQRYPIPGQQRIDYAESGLWLSTTLHRRGEPIVTAEGWPSNKRIHLDFRTAARLATEVMPRLGLRERAGGGRRVALLSGRHTPTSVRQANLHDQVVFYVMPRDGDTAAHRPVLAHLAAANDVVLLRDDDSSTFARRLATTLARPPELIDDYLSEAAGARTWAAEVRPEVAQPVLAVDGLDWAALRAETAPTVRPLPFTRAALHVRATPRDSGAALATGPNVVGVLTGTGNGDKSQGYQDRHVVISASLDDDSGLAGLLALARAFSQPGMRPRRSVLFLATSGRASGGLGGSYFVHQRGESVVAHLGLEGLGGPAGDSLWITGLRDLVFAVAPAWVIGQQPDLGLTVAEDDDVSDRPTNHLAFLRGGVPSLVVRGVPTSRAPADSTSAAPVDEAYAARVVRAALYVGWEIAAAEHPPRRTPEGRRRFLQPATP